MSDSKNEDRVSPDFVQTDTTEQGLSRRDLLKRAGVIGMTIAIPAGIAGQTPTAEAAPAVPAVPADTYVFKSFTPAEVTTLNAMVERLIPTDENGPGAIAAGVPHYIDRLLQGDQNERYGPNNPHQTLTEAYGTGLKAIDAYSQQKRGGPFAGLEAKDQDEILKEMEENKATGFTPNSRTFFNLLRENAMEGMFCDPYYGGNVNFIGWDLTNYPGTKLSYTAEEQTFGGKIERVHKGFMDYAIFSDSTKGM